MSIRFSRVEAMSGDKAALFLVGGIPNAREDLIGWTAFRLFCEGLEEAAPIMARIEVFEYGEGVPYDATPEEIAYIYMRSKMRADFIEKRTRKTAEFELLV